MMKKCGVVTLYGMANYGNRLQNYAIIKVLNRLGYEADNFCDVKMSNILKRNLQLIYHRQFKDFFRRRIFVKTDRAITHNIYANDNIVKKSKQYSYIICGSDQIWNPYWAGTKHLFGGFAPPSKRIAYAASFGVAEIPDDRKEEFKKNLSEMKAVSVREQAGVEIIEKLTDKKVDVLIDPTLMLTKEEWKKFSKKPKFNVPPQYILTYFLGDADESRKKYIDGLCKECGYKLINLDEKNKNDYWYKTGPAEFLWLVENCRLMLTDSFHGTVFSVLMESPFIVFERLGEKMGSRIDTLLDTLQLQDRKFNNQNGDEIFEKRYDHIDCILERERKRTLDFLTSSMEG